MIEQFPQTEDGLYQLAEPFDGMDRPESVTLTFDGVGYRFEGYAGTSSVSRVCPDVLLYENVTVVGGDGTNER